MCLWLALVALALLVVSFGASRTEPTRAGAPAVAADHGPRVREHAPSQLETSGVIDSDADSEDDSHPFDDSWHRALVPHTIAVARTGSSEPRTRAAEAPAWASSIGRGPRSTRGPPRV